MRMIRSVLTAALLIATTMPAAIGATSGSSSNLQPVAPTNNTVVQQSAPLPAPGAVAPVAPVPVQPAGTVQPSAPAAVQPAGTIQPPAAGTVQSSTPQTGQPQPAGADLSTSTQNLHNDVAMFWQQFKKLASDIFDALAAWFSIALQKLQQVFNDGLTSLQQLVNNMRAHNSGQQ